MKKFPMLLARIVVFGLGLTSLAAAAETTVKDGRFEFSFPDLQGKTVSQADERFKGKVLLVDIWGTWCAPCQQAIPTLVDLQTKYKDKGLEVVGLAFEGGDKEKDLRAIRRTVERKKINYTVLYGGDSDDAEKKLPALQGFHGFPTLIIIGRDGRVREVDTGYNPEETPKKLDAIVLELLEKKP